MRNARRFVENLIRQRRPRSFKAGSDEAAEIRAAILLRSAAPGAGEPSEAFVAGLRRQLEVSTQDPPPPGTSRRAMIVRTGSVAAASAAIGVGAGLAIGGGADDAPAAQTLTPNAGIWHPVGPSTSVPDGAIQAFDLGTVAGFVQRVNGELVAVSGTCTHLGCRLRLNLPAGRLDCPCHRTSFTPTGQVLDHQLPASPAPLPQIPVREWAGVIEILGPPDPE